MDFQKRYKEIILTFIEPFKKGPNVIGMTLGGGISRGTGDVFSEIDIVFFVKNTKDKNPPEGDIGVNGVWFDFKIIDYPKTLKKKWSMEGRWDLKHNKILFQRNKAISKLIKKKAVFDKSKTCPWKKILGTGERNTLFHEYRQLGNWGGALA